MALEKKEGTRLNGDKSSTSVSKWMKYYPGFPAHTKDLSPLLSQLFKNSFVFLYVRAAAWEKSSVWNLIRVFVLSAITMCMHTRTIFMRATDIINVIIF